MLLRVVLFAALFLLLPGVATAQLFPAFTETATTSNLGFSVNTTRGWEFTVSETLQVEELGFWDSSLDGLDVPHPVAIWLADMTLLTSATVPAGTAAPLDGTFRWVATTPVTLRPGNTYIIAAYWPANSSDLRTGGQSITFDSRVDLTNGRLANFTGIIFPDFTGTPVLNANFKAVAVTEPAVPSIHPIALYTLVPGLLIGVGLAMMRRQD